MVIKKALICETASPILLEPKKSIKGVLYLKMRTYKEKLILKKNPISRIHISKMSVAPYTMVVITFVTFPSIYLLG